jgi:membrane-associated protease RseP (regulator of RpoE activity)
MPAHLALFLVALAASSLLHLAFIAAAGLACRVRLRKLRVGIGPALLRSRHFELKLIPLAGSVEFENWRTEEINASTTNDDGDAIDPSRYLDLQPRHRQILISLSGCIALLLLAFAMIGPEAGSALGHGFAQIIGGALSPLERAQALLQEAHRLIRELPPAQVLGLVAVKLAALNLLPVAPFNGASAIAAALSGSSIGEFWWRRWIETGIWLSLAMGFSWLVALVAYIAA